MSEAQNRGKTSFEVPLIVDIDPNFQSYIDSKAEVKLISLHVPKIISLHAPKGLSQNTQLCIGGNLLYQQSLTIYTENPSQSPSKKKIPQISIDKFLLTRSSLKAISSPEKEENQTSQILAKRQVENPKDSDFYEVVLYQNTKNNTNQISVKGFVRKDDVIPCDEVNTREVPDYTKAEAIMQTINTLESKSIKPNLFALLQNNKVVGYKHKTDNFKSSLELAKSYKLDNIDLLESANSGDYEGNHGGDKRVVYDRGAGFYPQVINVDFIFLGADDVNASKKAKNRTKNLRNQKGIQTILALYPNATYLFDNEWLTFVDFTQFRF